MFLKNLLKTALIATVASWSLPENLAMADQPAVVTANKLLEIELTEFGTPSDEVYRKAKKRKKAYKRVKKEKKWKKSYKRKYKVKKRKYRPRKRVYRSYPRYRDPGRYIVPGIIIGGIIANEIYRNQAGLPQAHYRYCYGRYRSYRAYDNTFQPYHGPRRQCVSPYWP